MNPIRYSENRIRGWLPKEPNLPKQPTPSSQKTADNQTLIPPQTGDLPTKRAQEIFEQLKLAIIAGDEEASKAAAKRAINAGIPPFDILIKGCCEGLKVVGVIGENYRLRKYCLVDICMAEEALKAAVEVIKPSQTIGKVVIGTVENDSHDIGKDFVVIMLEAIGFEVHDLGLAVKSEEFLRKAQEINADLVAASAATYTATIDQRKLSETLKTAGIRSRIKYVVGGFSCTPEWARQIEADGYGEDALEALKISEELLKKLKEERKTKLANMTGGH
jgi:methanogenic corrinoid protein MtbC1